jgi:hypothetical protein
MPSLNGYNKPKGQQRPDKVGKVGNDQLPTKFPLVHPYLSGRPLSAVPLNLRCQPLFTAPEPLLGSDQLGPTDAMMPSMNQFSWPDDRYTLQYPKLYIRMNLTLGDQRRGTWYRMNMYVMTP